MDYKFIFKTSQSEERAWNNLDDDCKRKITPLVEITRGRAINGQKDKYDPKYHNFIKGIYNFDKVVDTVVSIFKNPIFIDATVESELSSYEIAKLKSYNNGYSTWINFLDNLTNQKVKIKAPVIQIDPNFTEENLDQYETNLVHQFKQLASRFDGIAYRAYPLVDKGYRTDLTIISELIKQSIKSGKKFYLFLDMEVITPGVGSNHAQELTEIIKLIDKVVSPNIIYIISATSFPRSVTALGNEEHDSFFIEEHELFERVIKNFKDDYIFKDRILYCDYASNNPIRNDLVFARGWRPRIDYPINDRIIYYREKSGNRSYGTTYQSVANKILSDYDINNNSLINSWGHKQIEKVSNGDLSKRKSPSFWMSVRMEIFIHRQLEYLEKFV